jgi:preprotein translocase subunit YajC
MSAVAHCIAGVLDHDSMAQIVNDLSEAADVQPGDRVKTLRGSMHGTVVRVLADGRVVWRADTGTELTALPESLAREQLRA